MEDRLTPTKLLKDWQQLMLGMREDQILLVVVKFESFASL
jgi:hypothetical protein